MEKKKKKSTSKKVQDVKKEISKKEESTKEVVAEVKEVITKTVEEKQTKKKSNHLLFKVLAISIIAAVLLSWILPSGSFNGTEYVSSAINRTGINELFLSMFYGANYYLLQIVFLLVLGVFYGVLSKTSGYNKMVENLAKFWKGKEKIFVLLTTLVIALFVSVATQSFPILLFVPLIYSIATKLEFSKLSAFATTFGAMLVGAVGQTYSTYGLDYITQNMATKLSDGVGIRFAILAIAYLLLNVIIILSLKKKNEEKAEELFEEENKKDGKVWPYAVLFIVLFALIVLGYMPWESFDIKVFTEFHKWLTTELVVTISDKEHAIFGYLLGNIGAFGTWDIYTISYISMISLIFVKLFAKIKFDDCLDYALEGVKKMAKPALYVMIAYSMFVISYWSGFTTWIINGLNSFGRVELSSSSATYAFNPYTNALGNALASFFHVDFGYSGYLLSPVYASRFADYKVVIMTILTSMNGFISLFAPTSVVLVAGLSMYDVSYKKWMKYIWKLIVGLLIALLLVFTLMTYM